eukprot:s35_g46.t1
MSESFRTLQDHSFDNRYCSLYGTCSSDGRFAWLGEHLRGTLVRTCGGLYLKGFKDIGQLAEQLFDLVVQGPDSPASRADVLLCTHPPYSCRLFMPFVERLGLYQSELIEQILAMNLAVPRALKNMKLKGMPKKD